MLQLSPRINYPLHLHSDIPLDQRPATIDDVMEFLVAGASAVQLGTVNFYRPTASIEVLDALPVEPEALGA